MRKKRRIEPVVHIIEHDDGNADLQYWLIRTPEERINAVLQLMEQHMRVMGQESRRGVEPVVIIVSP
jgi:hypothetical protein